MYVRNRSSLFVSRSLCLALVSLLCSPAVYVLASDGPGFTGKPVKHVIHISVDGLRPDAVSSVSATTLPNFYRLRNQGSFTDNARTDYDYTITLPNHISQLTGRRVTGPNGHNWTVNGDPKKNQTLHSNKGSYVASVFDVTHDNGIRTGAYVSKSKFVLLDQSYNESTGADDRTDEDNGRDKIDSFVYESDTRKLVDRFVADMKQNPFGYAFIHLRDPDAQGHKHGWSLQNGSPYSKSVQKVDQLVGDILNLVENDPNLAGNTVVILTSDHGGGDLGHGSCSSKSNYTIPFYVWGAGIPQEDLYAISEPVRKNPGESRPDYAGAVQPIRNGDAANLSLGLLGLDGVPGSLMDTLALLEVYRAPRYPVAYAGE